MTAILSLPQYRATAGVGLLEDWLQDIVFLYADGSPIDLTGITFATSLKLNDATSPIYTGATGGDLTIGGAGSNILSIRVLASQKAAWTAGAYAWSLLATDGTRARAVFAGSTLRVGAARALELLRLSVLSSGATLTGAPSPSDIVFAALLAMPLNQRRAVLNTLFAAAASEAAGDDPADFNAGEVFVNGSSYPTILQ